MLRKFELRNATAPDPGNKKGGRSRPPPISRIGHGEAGNMAAGSNHTSRRRTSGIGVWCLSPALTA